MSNYPNIISFSVDCCVCMEKKNQIPKWPLEDVVIYTRQLIWLKSPVELLPTCYIVYKLYKSYMIL